MTARNGSPSRLQALAPVAAGLWIPATGALLVGLVLLVAGIAEMPPDLKVEGGSNTEAVGAPATAALFTVWGPNPAWSWLVGGTIVAVLGGLATLVLVPRLFMRRGRPSIRTKALGMLAGGLLLLGLALLATGLLRIPRDFVDQLGRIGLESGFGDLEDADLAIPIRGRSLMDAGTALVALSAVALLTSGWAQRRSARSRPESAESHAV